ncbi:MULTISPECIES: NADP-dependent glyceraldehyde-3-phosphate dehydrogenase [unclassified Clostridium]|uniref:NADP-dependent glyceraldehyde-3-phosphate dehydrogenase n=1 Tax=unclassified Clostridium TaxID=2614128 RepID=UPI0025BC1B8D|nr:NADP-dependent glyceraldehyde-3-phosphate dehydrogenase [Clostridium sp.]MDY2630334.1 NADP-dependent glyceraldehyde-3-phosphate dehydrogenase [Clostridium sp.]MDY4252688.1 NADP-dependent glyceraldehyde-3-phosphate dehydrogenase [Clostridium sp.]MDY6228482.1 NADP-dependent glyceraldehyde-3-phosphate dehydrogenase [Clostridium sp.]
MFSCIRGEELTFKNLVNGEWVTSNSNKYIEIYSPIGNCLVGKVPAMTKEEVDFAIKNAKETQISWKNVPVNKRAEILYKAADLLIEKSDEMSDIMMREIGKDKKSCESEILRSADYVRFTADTAKNLSGESIPGDSFPGFKKNKISLVTREPLGVVLAISPFNYPVNLASSKIAPALIAGNSVVLKPATQGSLCGLYLAKIFEQAGVPAGVLNTVTGRGSEIGDYIVTHPSIDFINFTGSTEVGTRISKITSMVPLLMELGGKDAAIVLKDADLDLAASNIVSGAYSYSGQRCTAVKRILVVEEVADKLVEKVKEKVEKLKVGNPLDGAEVVPLIDNKAADFVWELIDDAREKGAHLLVGGKREENLIYPTLFDNVTTDMRLAWEEPFGPVLPIIRVKDKDEAIEIANKSEYGLQSSVFTENINEAFYVADKLEVGTVQVNNKTERGPDHFPFLGVKASGIGTQGIKYSIEAMSRPKATVINIGR